MTTTVNVYRKALEQIAACGAYPEAAIANTALAASIPQAGTFWLGHDDWVHLVIDTPGNGDEDIVECDFGRRYPDGRITHFEGGAVFFPELLCETVRPEWWPLNPVNEHQQGEEHD